MLAAEVGAFSPPKEKLQGITKIPLFFCILHPKSCIRSFLALLSFNSYLTYIKQKDDKMTKTLTAVLHKEDDMYIADCPEVGTVSQGYTVEEAIANLREATELYLEEFPLQTYNKALLTTFEAAVGA